MGRRAFAVLFALVSAAERGAFAETPGEAKPVSPDPVPSRTEIREDPRGSLELYYREGALAEERLISREGTILEEKLHRGGGDVVLLQYFRTDGRLVRVEASDASGSVTGSVEYRYDRSGRLIGTTTKGSMGSEAAGMQSTGAVPQGAWITTPSSTFASLYDSKGRPLSITTLQGGTVASVEKRQYASGGSQKSAEIEDRITGTTAQVEYDSAGRPAVRTEFAKGSRLARIEYEYDESGRLAVERVMRTGSVVEKNLTYDSANVLVREETRQGGVIQLIVVFSGEERIEDLYNGGALFVRATYKGGRKVKDEFFMDGISVRTKEYK